MYKKNQEMIWDILNFQILKNYSAFMIALFTFFVAVAAIAESKLTDADSDGNEINSTAIISPDPQFSPDQVVRIQLNALAKNDIPYLDAGIEIAFRFASPANKNSTGPLNRFIQLVHNPVYKPMLNHRKVKLGDMFLEDGKALLPAFLTDSNGERMGYMFILSRQEGGEFDQCWMTDAVLRFELTST